MRITSKVFHACANVDENYIEIHICIIHNEITSNIFHYALIMINIVYLYHKLNITIFIRVLIMKCHYIGYFSLRINRG